MRSRLTQIVSGCPFSRGYLQEVRRVCGKPNCRCTRGAKHRALQLLYREGGRTRQIYVPVAWEARVREWVNNYRTLRQVMKEVADLYRQKVQRREE